MWFVMVVAEEHVFLCFTLCFGVWSKNICAWNGEATTQVQHGTTPTLPPSPPPPLSSLHPFALSTSVNDLFFVVVFFSFFLFFVISGDFNTESAPA